jgi:hypothetical protein
MPSALKIWKDARSQRRNVAVKTEKTVVDTSSAHSKVVTGEDNATAKARGQTETAVYTSSPAIPRDQVTQAQKTRAEVLTKDLKHDREELYGESVRLV